ncbi:MAG: hypothetical protein ACK5GV_01200 [Bacteroidota bacterium]|jgi:hypothetical protein
MINELLDFDDDFDADVLMLEVDADRQARIANAVTRIEQWVLTLNAELDGHGLELEQSEIDEIATALDELALLANGI